MHDALPVLNRQIVACELCPRLRTYGREVARVKRRAYLDWDYWGKPVPGFGDPKARVLLIGLAPGAHGANRTGRMFTGDSSGDFLYRALYETGFASQAESRSREDGLELRDAYITAAARCAPPDNKPLPGGTSPLPSLSGARAGSAEGSTGGGGAGRRGVSGLSGHPARSRRDPEPGRVSVRARSRYTRPSPGLPVLIASYHPSQQNTSTGKLTAAMLREVFEHARNLL